MSFRNRRPVPTPFVYVRKRPVTDRQVEHPDDIAYYDKFAHQYKYFKQGSIGGPAIVSTPVGGEVVSPDIPSSVPEEIVASLSTKEMETSVPDRKVYRPITDYSVDAQYVGDDHDRLHGDVVSNFDRDQEHKQQDVLQVVGDSAAQRMRASRVFRKRGRVPT